MRVPARARPMPVLPAVGSMIVPPFFRRPSRSARAIMPMPMRSFTEPPGLRNSSFAKMSAWPGPPMLVNCSIGVLPTRSRMLRTGFVSGRGKARGLYTRGGSGQRAAGRSSRTLPAARCSLQPDKAKRRDRSPAVVVVDGKKLCPARGSRARAALVVAIAAVDRLAADGGERHFGGHTATVARHADHGALAAAAAVALAGVLALVAAVLAALRLVRESTLCVKSLFVLAEDEFLSAVSTVQHLVVEGVHEPMIS